jgi:hypothetical protein
VRNETIERDGTANSGRRQCPACAIHDRPDTLTSSKSNGANFVSSTQHSCSQAPTISCSWSPYNVKSIATRPCPHHNNRRTSSALTPRVWSPAQATHPCTPHTPHTSCTRASDATPQSAGSHEKAYARSYCRMDAFVGSIGDLQPSIRRISGLCWGA